MTQKAVNNAKVLYRLNISRSDVEETHKIFTKAPFLLETLTNPVVSEEAKEVVLDKIARQSGMPELLENFMKMMCRIGFWTTPLRSLHRRTVFVGGADGGHGDPAPLSLRPFGHHHEHHRLFLPVGFRSGRMDLCG